MCRANRSRVKTASGASGIVSKRPPEGSTKEGRAWLRVVVVLLCLPFASSATAAKSPLASSIEALQQSHSSQPARLRALSTRLLGRPYLLSALGEGRGHSRDPDPRFRLDRFDCVTLTETLMALSWTRNLGQARSILQKIRYRQGRIGYGSRNHIMMAQWIPHNIANGMLQDISNKATKGKPHFADLLLSDSDFRTKAGRQLQLKKNERPRGSFRIGLLPLSEAQRSTKQFPTVSILSTVRRRDKNKPYRISHVGLLLRKEKRLVVHHADARKQRVIEEPYASFVARAKRQRSWPVVGFNVLSIAANWTAATTSNNAEQKSPNNVRHR